MRSNGAGWVTAVPAGLNNKVAALAAYNGQIIAGGWFSLLGSAGSVCWMHAPAPCYANCDCAAASPVLNVNDFVCFQSRFAAGDPYANCDGSTVAPTLNVNDFICFQALVAAGCP